MRLDSTAALLCQIQASFDADTGRPRCVLGVDADGRLWQASAGPSGDLGEWTEIPGPRMDLVRRMSTAALLNRYVTSSGDAERARYRAEIVRRGKEHVLDQSMQENDIESCQ